MSDGDRLFRAILESPRDDALRLVWADWLEEQGDAGRAEFVRVQFELASYPQDEEGWGYLPRPIKHRYAKWKELKRREAALLALRRPEPNDNQHQADLWASGGGWQAVTHGGGPFWLYPPAPFSSTGYDFAFRRGLVEEVTLYDHVLLNARVTAALFSSQPLLRVALRGKRPLKEEGAEFYCWTDHRGRLTDTPDWEVPRPLFDLLLPDRRCVRVRDSSFMYSTRGYATEADALDALSAAAVRLGRRAAGLPDLEV